MITSDSIDKIAPAWVAALQGVADVTKDSEGHHGKYASLAACLATVKPQLGNHGLAVQQYNRPGEGGKVVVVTRIWHESGQWLEDEGLAMAAPNDPQKVGGAVTYARRYSLTTFFAIATEDDDGHAATEHMRSSRQQAPRQEAHQEAPQARRGDSFSEAAHQVYNALVAQKGTPVAEHMKQWREQQGDNPPSFTLEALDGDPEWLDMVAGELADTLERQ